MPQQKQLKQRPEFARVETTGKTNVAKIDSLKMVDGYHDDIVSPLVLRMAPYSPFIPLQYLLMSPIPSGSSTIKSMVSYYKKIKNKGNILSLKGAPLPALLTGMALVEWRGTHTVRRDAIGAMGHYLYHDSIKMFTGTEKIWDGCRKAFIIKSFLDNKPSDINMRSWSGAISPYGLSMTQSGVEIPYILPVVLPENYIWMKLNLLKTSEIDLTKVIILIDDSVDVPSFPFKAFKSLYKELLPHVLESSCQVWKVPGEFIREQCFLHNYKMVSKNIFSREKEIKELVEEFYESVFTGKDTVAPLVAGTAGSLQSNSNLWEVEYEERYVADEEEEYIIEEEEENIDFM